MVKPSPGHEEYKYEQTPWEYGVPSLVLRHASGRLFQEAHAVLESQQFGLFGDSTIVTTPNYSPSGAYFTPVPIARMLAEWALQKWFGSEKTITIADYACGSGVFLTESLRALERNGFRGTVHIVGRDKSQQAIMIANVAIQTVLKDITTMHVDCDILQGDAFETTWPNADVVLMNHSLSFVGRNEHIRKGVGPRVGQRKWPRQT